MSEAKIEIVSTQFRQFAGTSQKGKAYDMAMQEAYLHLGGVYPEKFEVPLSKPDGGSYVPYAPGWYEPTAQSYQVRDNRLSINAFELKLQACSAPAAAAAPKPARAA